MPGEVAEELEGGGEARLGQHAPRVAADGEHAAGFDQVMLVESEDIGAFTRLAGRRTIAVAHRQAVVFAFVIEAIQLEQPPGCGEKLRAGDLCRDNRVGDGERPVRHKARVGETGGLGERDEVAPV